MEKLENIFIVQTMELIFISRLVFALLSNVKIGKLIPRFDCFNYSWNGISNFYGVDWSFGLPDVPGASIFLWKLDPLFIKFSHSKFKSPTIKSQKPNKCPEKSINFGKSETHLLKYSNGHSYMNNKRADPENCSPNNQLCKVILKHICLT
jgi:hypothetical protein